MTRSETRNSGRKHDSLWGEALAIGALGFAIVALIAISLANLGGPYVVTSANGDEAPVRIVASAGD